MKKKLIIGAMSLLLATGIAGTFWGSSIAEAIGIWNTCSHHCTYPGQCHSYIDTNGDNYCDRGQSDPSYSATTSSDTVATTTTTAAGAAIAAATTPTNSASGSSNDTTFGSSQSAAADTGNASLEGEATATSARRTYFFVPIFAAAVILYALTWTLSTRKIIRTILHRKIWNVILLVTALGSAMLGIFLTINIEMGINITLPFDMLFWHVEAGIALGIVAIFHILWHWRYFAKIVGVNPTPKSSYGKISLVGRACSQPGGESSRLDRNQTAGG